MQSKYQSSADRSGVWSVEPCQQHLETAVQECGGVCSRPWACSVHGLGKAPAGHRAAIMLLLCEEKRIEAALLLSEN